MVYQFDQFEVDDREFRLSEGGTPVQVEPKVLRLLVCLIENRSRLVRKQELLDAVWPDAMVTENALTRAIGLLRKALNEDSRVPRYVETVPTVGYRFIANVTAIDEKSEAGAVADPVAAVENGAGFRRPRRWMLAAAILLVGVAAAGASLFFHHGQKVLTETDTVVLGDFDNSTGDPIFDGTLRRGMAVQLQQSPFLSLIADDRIQQVLKEMGQPPDAHLTPAIAREICERTASAAVLDGSIAALGSEYILGLRARDCQSGKVLAEEQVQAARKEDVLNALDQIAGKFRTQVGESLTTVEKYDTPLAEATTSSLEALKAYSLGMQKSVAGAQVDALPFFSRAVELDPNFAAAYRAMAFSYGIQREPGLSADSIRKAYALREKVSETERLDIEIVYYWNVTGELEKARSAMELEQQTYPRDFGVHIGLGIINGRLGNSEKSLEEAREALRLNPRATANYQNLGADLVNLNRFDEAEAVYKLSDERNLAFAGRSRSLYFLAFLKGDPERMARIAFSAMGKRGEEDAMLGAQADTEAWYGRVNSARAFTRRAMDSALNYDARETAAGYQVKMAPFEAEVGYAALGRSDAEAAMKMAPNRDVRLLGALALAQAGDPAGAEKLADALDKEFPLDTYVQRYWLPTIRGVIALQRKDPGRALELLQADSPLDLGGASNLTNASFYPVYVRGEAYLLLHDGTRAAAEFQKYVDHRGLVRNSPIGMLGRLGLARAYAMQGDTAKAKVEYQEFLSTWKGADADAPILLQAKAEYAKLQ